MNLVGEHGKGESVWLGFFLYDVLSSSPRLPALAATCRLPTAAQPRPSSCAATSSRTAGTASGTAAPISTTARRLDRQRTPNARSIRLRRAGPFFPARAITSAHAWPWMRSIGGWSAASRADPAAGSAVRQVGVESRLYQRLCPRSAGKMAGSTRMPPSGRSWPSLGWATTGAPGSCSI